MLQLTTVVVEFEKFNQHLDIFSFKLTFLSMILYHLCGQDDTIQNEWNFAELIVFKIKSTTEQLEALLSRFIYYVGVV